MANLQEIYEKKIRQFERQYGPSEFSDIIRFTNDRLVTVTDRQEEIMKQFDKNMTLFSEQSLLEFKKLWTKLKEIEQRIPGPVVKPVDPQPPRPAQPDPAQPKISSKK